MQLPQLWRLWKLCFALLIALCPPLRVSLKWFVIALTAKQNVKLLNLFAEKKSRCLNVIWCDFHLQTGDMYAFFCKNVFGLVVFVYTWATFFTNWPSVSFSVKLCSAQKFVIEYGISLSITQYQWMHAVH